MITGRHRLDVRVLCQCVAELKPDLVGETAFEGFVTCIVSVLLLTIGVEVDSCALTE